MNIIKCMGRYVWYMLVLASFLWLTLVGAAGLVAAIRAVSRVYIGMPVIPGIVSIVILALAWYFQADDEESDHEVEIL